jgi:hypothetical protein
VELSERSDGRTEDFRDEEMFGERISAIAQGTPDREESRLGCGVRGDCGRTVIRER